MSHQTLSSYPQVIVAGMPRTGTESIKQALEILYGNDASAYHMTEVLNRPKHLEIWSDLAFGRRQVDQVDWKQLLKGYIATTDLPCAFYFKELTEAFPDAKVVLTVREESEWFESYCRLVVATHRFRSLRFLPPLNRFWPYAAKLNQIVFGDNALNESGPVREVVIDAYRRHNERVCQLIAPDRLLEFNVRQGWRPLCEFLELDIPESDFPHSNVGTSGPSKIISKAVFQLSSSRALIVFGIVFVLSMILLSITMRA
ncbi:sulfotransferase [Cyanobacteria bacterium FACHB-471]|nr:sulfotransferase [Cyanobacteria bacterium FACHB-471]